MKQEKRHIIGVLVLLGCVFIGFHKAWEKLIDNTAVIWTQLYFDNTVLFRCLVLISILAIFIFTKHRRTKWIQVCVSIVIILYWIYYRFIDKHWSFEDIYSVTTYFDLLLLVPLKQLVNEVVYWRKLHKKSSIDNTNLSIIDSPIETIDDDILNRKTFVKSFSNTLIDNVTNGVCRHSAYSISINAAWGDGKTSFMNLIRKHIESNPKTKQQFEFVNFEPWMYPSNILSEFFNLLQRHVSLADYRLSNAISRYASVLEGTKATFFSKFLSALSRKTISEQFDAIKEELTTIGKTYIVVIDDMDRLSGSEILEVFRLIRSSANFPNLVFILLYDKQYVLKALKETGARYTDSFSDKFVNTEYYLPSYNTEILKEFAKRMVNDVFADKCSATVINKLDIFLNESDLFASKSIIETVLTTPRDVKRWISSMLANYINVENDVDVDDYAVLELVRLKFPSIYNALKYHHELYLFSSHHGLVLWNEKIELNGIQKIMNQHKKDIYNERFFKELEDEEQEIVRMLLSRLFTRQIAPLDAKPINNEIFFHRYFYNCLQADEISTIDYRQRIENTDFEQIKSYLQSNVEKIDSFVMNIERDTTNDDTYILKNKIRTIFLAGSLIGSATTPDRIRVLITKLPDVEQKEVLYNALTENGASKWAIMFISKLYLGYTYSDEWKKIISEEEISQATCEIFKYVLSDLGIPEIADFYFWTNLYKDEKRKANPAVTKLLKDYIKQNPDKMLSFLIYTDDKDYKVHKYYLSDYVEDFYSDINSMLKEFADDDRPSVSEFRDFVKQYQDNGNEPIQFQFTHIIKKRVE